MESKLMPPVWERCSCSGSRVGASVRIERFRELPLSSFVEFVDAGWQPTAGAFRNANEHRVWDEQGDYANEGHANERL